MQKTIQALKNAKITSFIALVLVWRGIWFLMDYVDSMLFPEARMYTAAISVAVGLLIIHHIEHKKEAGGTFNSPKL